jgi:hypothetical protein
MLKFETLFLKLIQSPKFLLTFLIGGLLCFVPILHFFAFGYLFFLTKKIVTEGSFEYPEWTDFPNLFIKGIELTAISIIFLILPFLLFKGMQSLLNSIGLSALSSLLSGFLFLIAMPILASVLYRYQTISDIRSLFDLSKLFQMSASFFQSNVIVLLTGFAITQLFLPLYGFSIFGSLLILLSYSSIYFSYLEIHSSK